MLNSVNTFFYLDTLTGFLICFIFTVILLKTKKYHKSITFDYMNGPQKIHNENVIRIGGLSIFLSLSLNVFFISEVTNNILLYMIIVSAPTFFAGFLEDITKKISPYFRLLASFFSAILFLIIFEMWITYVNIQVFDFLLTIPIFSIFFTTVCIVLLTQSMNIIDGLNGLSLGCAIIMSISMLFLCFQSGVHLLIPTLSVFIGCLLGCFFFNFPKSNIFIGDGGAYLIGLFLACLIIILSNQTSLVSPFYFFLLVLYPIYECGRSFLRRVFFEKNLGFKPDQKHLHSMLFKFLSSNSKNYNINAIASLYILFFQLLYSILGFHFYNNREVLILLIFMFVLNYELIYFYIKKSFKKFNF